MMSRILLPIMGLAAIASARQCQNLTINLDLSARNGVFDLETPVTNIDVTDYILNLAKQGNNYTDSILTGYATISGMYKIKATYCEPDHGASKVLQILTHGVGFDRSYWDLSFNDYNYSYVQTAVDEYGYSTLTYDRLGLGASSRGDPISEIQSWLEIAALKELTLNLRASKTPQLADKPFEQFVHVGHSYGSIISYSVTAADPEISDGLILTGFTQSPRFVPLFLFGGGFVQANTLPALGDYADGYLALGRPTGVHANFLAPDQFDPEILELAFRIQQPVTVGEFLTQGAGAGNVNAFAGPVLVITGERDVPFCGGDCSNTGEAGLGSFLDISANLLKNATPFDTYVVRGAGHGLAVEYSHVETTGKMLDFLTQNGLPGNL